MRLRPRHIIGFVLFLSFQLLISDSLASPQAPTAIYGQILDAETRLPIPNATILVWDLDAFGKTGWESRTYSSDERGEYLISDKYLVMGHTYVMYAYKGNFTTETVDYVPSVTKLKFESSEEVNFSLVPGAVIKLEGKPYIVQSSSPGGRSFIKVVDENGSDLVLNASFVHEYGNSADAWFLGLGEELVIVPADTPVFLEARIPFFSRRQRGVGREVFTLYNGSLPFLLPQGGRGISRISRYSLRRGLDIVNSRLVDVSSQLDEAQSTGFVVFEERRSIARAQQKRDEAGTLLTRAKDEEDYETCWTILRDVLVTADLVEMNLGNMRLVSVSSAIYLPAITAVFSLVLAFFSYEKTRMKILASVVIYIFFLVGLYFLYPGAHIVIDENARLFLGGAAVSFLGVSGIVFGLPRVWKERSVEGEVSFNSVISIIFSMGKRQIRRKRIRGFFTILSLMILVLAFTSLTSVGTVFGVVSERLGVMAPSDGVMVKRVLDDGSLLFSPLGSDDPTVLSKRIGIKNVALRLETPPSSSPVVRLMNPETGDTSLIYGILGITPGNESIYTQLDEIVDNGSYLDEVGADQILLATSVANNLDIEVGEKISLEVLGAGVSSSFIVKGLINDEEYMSLVDMDGGSFGPSRLLSDGSSRITNSTEVVVMSWKGIERLQEMANERYPGGAPRIAVLSEIVFQLGEGVDMTSTVRTLVLVFDYDVFASYNKIITHYRIGSYVNVKGAAELIVPLIMVVLNVGMVMMNSVYERRREIRTLSMLGLNPTHIGLIFVAEAIILGMVGGSLGYLLGLGFYRVMVLFGQDLMVREKLEWWWSAIGFALALTASVLSSIRPATLAVSTYTPSRIKRLRVSEEKREFRKEEIFKVYQARELSMPVKVGLNEKDFFISYFLDRFDELRIGRVERVENVEEMAEIERVGGELVKSIKFDYQFVVSGRERRTRNTLILSKSPEEDYYRVKLVSEPAVPGMPESAIDRTIDFVHDAVLYWVKNKERMIGV